jgi:hypothetical protein
VLVAEANGAPVGYCISRDRYLKRDELGVIYQLCVAPGYQRGLIGAALIREVFARSAYGCRLYCCWCAQDLPANYFWESLGFVPVAFRAGSSGKKRVHIFWQKRICEGDTETKWWYPFQTNSGAIREDRIVFPIPPGVRWQEVEAVSVPRGTGRVMEDKREAKPRREKRAAAKEEKAVPRRLWFVASAEPVSPAAAKKEREPKAKREKVKIDPAYLAKARELRDRYMERINSDPRALVGCGKYEVARTLGDDGQDDVARRMLPAA